ncbi:MAG: hypothetical protein LCH38_14440 [Proteobacteria bacterium]|nr:hypothetical protein [Pseudomonadota bacterium]
MPDGVPVPPPAIIEVQSSGHAGAQFARDPAIAEHEELTAALSKGTAEALELFIARHPLSSYRAEAERALGQLREQFPQR